MARREVIWMPRARSEYKETLHFYNQRNGNAEFSKKIQSAVKRRLAKVIEFPEIGHKCDKENIRIVTVLRFGVFYELRNDQILVHSFWDFRRNPEDRIDKI